MKKEHVPKVTVLMPVYNANAHLNEAINSILDQTFVDFEFLIMDDGSTDASEVIISAYKDPRIRYVKNQENWGLVETLNRGIELAKGEYIARMDADDISLPQRLSKQISFLEDNPQIGACGTAYQYFGDKNKLEILPTDDRRAFTLLASTSCLGHPTSIIRKVILDRYAIRYESQYGYAADYALWVTISQISPICSLAEPLLRYRWHVSNMSRTDPGRAEARSKVRILWHELLLNRTLAESQKNYLRGLHGWKTLRSGKQLLLTILNDPTISSRIDKQYYGELMGTEWELTSIKHFGLLGLIMCLWQRPFRQWSSVTSIGLVAHYLPRTTVLLKSLTRNI